MPPKYWLARLPAPKVSGSYDLTGSRTAHPVIAGTSSVACPDLRGGMLEERVIGVKAPMQHTKTQCDASTFS
jgi:hypothetical protein